MKLEVGMYIRTNLGIEKITSLESEYNCLIAGVGTEKGYIQKKRVVKASHNIIDLIEVGDYVNGHLVTAIYNPNGDEMYHISLQNGKDYILIHNDDEIKSILTHEQYEANCYKVAE
jgi:hypothetical protein